MQNEDYGMQTKGKLREKTDQILNHLGLEVEAKPSFMNNVFRTILGGKTVLLLNE